MRVIDVDSHVEPRGFADGEHPLWELQEHLPPFVDVLVENIAGDLYHAMPEDERPEPGALLARFGTSMGMSADTIESMADARPVDPAAVDIDMRVAWMDRVGIDFQLLNPGGAYAGSVASSHRFLRDPDVFHRAIVLCNDYLADHVASHTDRISPTTLLDFDDLDWSIAELTRMRGRGSRAYFVPATPFEGRSPAHPAVDRFWAAASDLGTVGIVHIGLTPAHFASGWADAGWDDPRGAGVGGFLRFANSQRTQSAQTLIAALVLGGTFTRNPRVTIVLDELWASWLPWFVDRLDMLGDANGQLGPWEQPRSPGELARHHVKGSPLPGLHDDGMTAIHEVPDMLVFSSDFPHNEGNAEPIAVYGDALERLDPATREAFLGGTMSDVFARTGDPLPI